MRSIVLLHRREVALRVADALVIVAIIADIVLEPF